MSADIIVSYDGTPNDDDALALGLALSAGGATIALAYVRHFREFDARREELAQHDAERRLEAGAARLGTPEMPTHVVLSASTDSGLEQLAAAESAKLIVFGSDYRTTPGRTEPGNTAQRLLDGAPVAIAVARAGLRDDSSQSIRTIAVREAGDGSSVRAAAEQLAASLGASVVEGGSADLVVIGSSTDVRPGRLALTGSARSALGAAIGSIVILPGGASAIL